MVNTRSRADSPPLLPVAEVPDLKTTVDFHGRKLLEMENSIRKLNIQQDEISNVLAKVSSDQNLHKADLDKKFDLLMGKINQMLKDKNMLEESSSGYDSIPPNRADLNELRGRRDEIGQSGQNFEGLHFSSGDKRGVKLPKIEFTLFENGNPREWLQKGDHNFRLHQIPNHLKLGIAICYMKGEGFLWGNSYIKEHGVNNWGHFVSSMYHRFDTSNMAGIVGEFTKIKQIGSVVSYMKKFVELKAAFVSSGNVATNSYFVDLFLSGLKEEIRSLVSMFKPASIEEASRLAIDQEFYISSMSKVYTKPTPKPSTSPYTSPQESTSTGPRTYNNSPVTPITKTSFSPKELVKFKKISDGESENIFDDVSKKGIRVPYYILTNGVEHVLVYDPGGELKYALLMSFDNLHGIDFDYSSLFKTDGLIVHALGIFSGITLSIGWFKEYNHVFFVFVELRVPFERGRCIQPDPGNHTAMEEMGDMFFNIFIFEDIDEAPTDVQWLIVSDHIKEGRKMETMATGTAWEIAFSEFLPRYSPRWSNRLLWDCALWKHKGLVKLCNKGIELSSYYRLKSILIVMVFDPGGVSKCSKLGRNFAMFGLRGARYQIYYVVTKMDLGAKAKVHGSVGVEQYDGYEDFPLNLEDNIHLKGKAMSQTVQQVAATLQQQPLYESVRIQSGDHRQEIKALQCLSAEYQCSQSERR